MKKTSRLLFSACLMAALKLTPAVSAAPLILPPANVFYTSFESSGSPVYSAGALSGQNGWSLKGSTVNAAAQVIIGGSAGVPASPDGSQMVALRNAKNSQNVYAGSPKAALQFSTIAHADALYFSGITGYSGTISENTGVISRLYLNDTSEFNGVIFGLHQDGEEVRFFYNNGQTATSFGSIATADTFYRFELDINIATKKFDIRVYSEADNLLLGSSTGAAFRGNTATLSYLRLNNLSNPTGNGDDFVTYYDQIWISTQAIPEPATWGLLLGGCGFLMLAHRRPRRTVLAKPSPLL